VEHTHVDQGGNKLYVEVSTNPIRDPDGRIVQIIHASKDITERKRAEQALRESEEQYRRLVDLSPDGIAIQVAGKYVFMTMRDREFWARQAPARSSACRSSISSPPRSERS